MIKGYYVNRRECLKFIALATTLGPVDLMAAVPRLKAEQLKKYPSPATEVHKIAATPHVQETPLTIVMGDKDIKDYLTKVRHPNSPHQSDIVLVGYHQALLKSVVRRFERVRAYVGHGHFCVLGFEEACSVAARTSRVGAFTPEECEFLEEIFWRDATDYGFYGDKQIFKLSEKIAKKDIYKVPYTGNYLFRGEPIVKYDQIKEDLGKDLILTSGVRGLAKQFYLFLSKAYRYQGNLSLASRSLAPPGYSYHGTGDFDVGQKGLGGVNFSAGFLQTKVYLELTERGYVRYRYDKDNLLGVRYEPWHIKV